ncbi:MAG: hypothetical protein JW720_07465 [Sedimentisphaerales bacterium]|nr:hypothetical protein [Sedimentisphaerales bacterium]
MKFSNFRMIALAILMAAALCLTASAARNKKKAVAAKAEESERKVTEAEVPKAALNTLKKRAGEAKITEFAEEIEHGSTFYEASFKNKAGANTDVLVTAAGALVETEQEISAKKLPAAVRQAAAKAAGKGAKLACEKKTMILYEVKFSKDGTTYEILLTPDGRIVEKDAEKGGDEENGDGDGNGDGDDKHKANAAIDDDDDDDDDDDEDDDDEDDDDDDDEDDED